MIKSFGKNRNISAPMEKVLSRPSFSNVEYVYAPDEFWYETREKVMKTLSFMGKKYDEKLFEGRIHNPCMYIKADYSGRNGEKEVLIITDREENCTCIYYIDKD